MKSAFYLPVLMGLFLLALILPQRADAITMDGLYQGSNKITSFDFATLAVSGGSVRTPDFTLRIIPGSVPDNSTWTVSVAVAGSFTGPGGTLASSQFAVQGQAQGAGWGDLSTQRPIQTAIGSASSSTGAFRMRVRAQSGLRAGNYSGSFIFYAVQSGNNQTVTYTVNATAHVLGRVVVLDILNVTGDVVQGSTAGAAVTSFSFPTQTSAPNGRVRSDTFRIRANANTPWDSYISINGPFVKQTNSSKTKPVTSFGICFALCPTVGFCTEAGVSRQISDAAPAGNPSASADFQIASIASTSTEAGTYTGSFTITIMVD